MQKSKMPSLVSILILTLITVVVWISFDVYRLFNRPPDPVVPEEVSKPLDPTLDQETINQIESRLFFDDSQIIDQVVNFNNEQVIETNENTTNVSNENNSTSADVTQEQ